MKTESEFLVLFIEVYNIRQTFYNFVKKLTIFEKCGEHVTYLVWTLHKSSHNLGFKQELLKPHLNNWNDLALTTEKIMV